MFVLLDFLEELRLSPAGIVFGNTSPVKFTFSDLKKYIKAKQHFKEEGYLVELLNIMNEATIGFEKNSKPVCREKYKVEQHQRGVNTYVVYIFTPKIKVYRKWLETMADKTSFELRGEYLHYDRKNIRLYQNSSGYKIIKFLISRPLHTYVKLSEIKQNLQQYRDVRGQIISNKQIYNSLRELRQNIIAGLTVKNKPPWGRINKGTLKLEI